MSNIFESIQIRRPKRSAFDLSHERKFTCNMGDLVPILCEEVVPGDSFKMNTEIFMRLMPLASPVMHRVNVFTHFFFVPYRLIWDNYQKFITGGDDGAQNAVMPYILINDDDTRLAAGTLADYLGISIADPQNGVISFSSLAFRAYQLIRNEYYRDQNLQVPVAVPKTDGQESQLVLTELMKMRKRCWEKDYFTSALANAQKGTEVNIPMGSSAPVIVDPNRVGFPIIRAEGGQILEEMIYLWKQVPVTFMQNKNNVPGYIDPNDTLVADLSNASSTTVNQLRVALRLQEWFEKNNRAGSRYIEQILSHFGVRVPDHRLQRPEYLGGGKSPIVISEVLQTSSTDTTSPQGNLAGHGMAVGNTHRWKNSFQEHGLVIGIMSTLPRTAYQQGTRRFHLKTDRFDFAWPEFANLGEQEVFVHELYCNSLTTNKPFGYQQRYAEYKYIPSSVHGQMKGNLDHWQMAREFANEPALNDEFVSSDPTHRVFAVTDPAEHKLIVQLYNSITAIRPLPYFGSPSII